MNKSATYNQQIHSEVNLWWVGDLWEGGAVTSGGGGSPRPSDFHRANLELNPLHCFTAIAPPTMSS